MKDKAEYISQLDHLSDWLIAFVTILFGISVISQLLLSEGRIKRISDQYEEQKSESTKHIIEVEERFKSLEIVNIDAFANMHEFQGLYYREKGHMLEALNSYINGLKNVFAIRELKGTDYEAFEELTKRFILEFHSTVSEMVKNLTINYRGGEFFKPPNSKNHRKYLEDIYSDVNSESRFLIDLIKAKIQEGENKVFTMGNEIMKPDPPKKKTKKNNK